MSILIHGQIARTNRIGFTLGVIAGILIYALSQAAHGAPVTCNKQGCSDAFHQRDHARTFSAKRHTHDANGNATVIIGGRPSGCPRAYCGCGLAKYLGLTDRRLNLADNWRKLFPRTHAQSGAVAVRSYKRRGHGHVMLLVRHIEGLTWLVRDYNSGRGLSRIHARSVRGFVFVDPRARQMAMGN